MPIKNPHPLYSVWQSMKRRCNNPNSPSYHRYGGRGISVCKEWTSDFFQFVADMGERPENTSLERIDNNKGYEPSNCKWATRKEQQRNRAYKVVVTIGGIDYRAIELADICGLKVDTIVQRASIGLSYEEVIAKERRVFANGLAAGAKASSEARKARTHCQRGHAFDEKNSYINKNGDRFCRACRAMKAREKRRLFKELEFVDGA